MTPLHPAFRKLIQQNIPQLDDEKLNRYDGLLALRFELIHQRSLVSDRTQPPVPSPRSRIEALIDETTKQANDIIAPFRREFDALHRLWMARRGLALQQGGVLQIPTTREEWSGLVKAIGNYYRVQIATFPVLARNRVKNNWRFVVAVAVMIALIYFGANVLKDGRDRDPNPKPPGTKPDTTIQQDPPRVQ